MLSQSSVKSFDLSHFASLILQDRARTKACIEQVIVKSIQGAYKRSSLYFNIQQFDTK